MIKVLTSFYDMLITWAEVIHEHRKTQTRHRYY
jgi:hypothetical protein